MSVAVTVDCFELVFCSKTPSLSEIFRNILNNISHFFRFCGGALGVF
jgi:hypothetical protein